MPEHITPRELAVYDAVARAVNMLQSQAHHLFTEVAGLSRVQFQILFALARNPGGLRMHELADRAFVSRSGLTYQVRMLEQEGLVTRRNADANERAVIAELTSAGEKRTATMQRAHFGFMHDHFLGLLSESELDTLAEIFTRVGDSLLAREAGSER